MIIIIVFLKITGIDYSVFRNNTRFLNFMLGPSVVALGYVLYEQIYYLKGNIISILTAVFVGCIVGIVSVVGIAKLMGTDTQMLFSLAPKSVTTPIAISIAKNNHGIPELAVVFVIICGTYCTPISEYKEQGRQRTRYGHSVARFGYGESYRNGGYRRRY